MTNRVVVELDAKDAAMVAAWQRARQNVQAFEQDLSKLKPTQERNTKGMEQFVNRLVSVQQGVNLITSGMRQWFQYSQQLAQEADQLALKYDEIGRKFQVQSGLKGIAASAAQERIAQISIRQSYDVERANAAATQLVSSGFSAEEASGASLEEFLRVLNAANAAGLNVDPVQLAKSVTGYLQSQGMELNAQNLARLGRGTQRLFKSTNIQLADLVDVSKVGSLLGKFLTPEEQLAAISVSADAARPSSESATAFRGMVGSLAGARVNETKVKALQEMGLTPADVDLVGEGFQEVLPRLASGMEKMPEEQRYGALQKLFGQEYAAFAQDIITGRGKIAERVKLMSDDFAFLQDVTIATSGPAAGARRLSAQRELQTLDYARGDVNMASVIEQELRGQGYSPFRANFASWMYHFGRGIGLSADTAANQVLPYGSGLSADSIRRRVLESEGTQGGASLVYGGREITDPDEIATVMRELKESLERNTEATKANSQQTESNTKRKNAPDSRPAPPVPAAALSDR